GSASAAPIAADGTRMGLVAGEQGLGQTGLPQPATGIGAPGQASPAAPGIARVAGARRRRGQPSFFGLAIFKQFQKLGF
ncbi:MAG TPA: hypothetical protein VKD45_03870, partial [Hyphomicrobiaceae bacterium]|nr:hypothetical protein [Hyphomicrobiaceae bacterium]